MSKCPDCGLENVSAPMGTVVLCGRRVEQTVGVLYPEEHQWRIRMLIADQCKKAGERRLATGSEGFYPRTKLERKHGSPLALLAEENLAVLANQRGEK